MLKTIVRFLNVILIALVAGTIFGIWIGYNPSHLSASAYIEQQQGAIRSLNILMPLLGLIAIILTLFSAYLQKDQKSSFFTLLVAAAFLICSGLITRFGNQPINALVITWNPASPPPDWTLLRDKWWSFHISRTLAAMAGLCLIAWTSIRKD